MSTQSKYSMKFHWPFTYLDLHRALVATLAVTIAIFSVVFFDLSYDQALWLAVSAFFLVLTSHGKNKRQQSIHFLCLTLLGASSCALTILLHNLLAPGLFYLFIFCQFFLILSLPRFWSSMQIASIFLVVFLIIAATLPRVPAHHIEEAVVSLWLSFAGGGLLTLVINLVLPYSAPVVVKVDFSYIFKRAFRLSACLCVAFLLAYWADFAHPAWVGFAIITVSQANLGASMRRAGQRLLGTVAGIGLGVPIAIWLFAPWPDSRWLALIAVFFCLFTIIRYYSLGLFFGTLILSAIYLVVAPETSSAVHFILSRFLETVVGVILVLLAEQWIFPRRVLPCVRKSLQKYWEGVTRLLQSAETGNWIAWPAHLAVQKEALTQLRDHLDDFKYESFAFLSERYHQTQILMNLVYHFHRELLVLSQHLDKEGRVNTGDFFSSAFVLLQGLIDSYDLVAEERLALIESLIAECQRMRAIEIEEEERPEIINVLEEQLQQIVKQHQIILSLTWWKLHRPEKSTNSHNSLD